MQAEPHERTVDAEALREQLRHVYWIGGGSASGKSTIARRLSAEHGLRLYATDDLMSEHARRSTPEDSPFLTRFMAMDMDERWVNRSPAAMLRTFHGLRGESFDPIVEDVRSLPDDRRSGRPFVSAPSRGKTDDRQDPHRPESCRDRPSPPRA